MGMFFEVCYFNRLINVIRSGQGYAILLFSINLLILSLRSCKVSKLLANMKNAILHNGYIIPVQLLADVEPKHYEKVSKVQCYF